MKSARSELGGEAYHPDALEIPVSELNQWNPNRVVILKCPHCGLSAGVPKRFCDDLFWTRRVENHER
jgi:hypothetical protein